MPPAAAFSICLPNVYQKKRESAGKRGFPAFPFSGCLPDVYQGYFFRGKVPFFVGFGPVFPIFLSVQGALYRASAPKSPQNLEKTGVLLKNAPKKFKEESRMRNLKRALSLALASVMVMGLMVAGTGASYADVSSEENQEAWRKKGGCSHRTSSF